MMDSPEGYMQSIMKKSYKELLKEKECLVKAIKYFEEGKCSEKDYMQNPSPEVVYLMNLKYLAKLCEMIYEQYHHEKM